MLNKGWITWPPYKGRHFLFTEKTWEIVLYIQWILTKNSWFLPVLGYQAVVKSLTVFLDPQDNTLLFSSAAYSSAGCYCCYPGRQAVKLWWQGDQKHPPLACGRRLGNKGSRTCVKTQNIRYDSACWIWNRDRWSCGFSYNEAVFTSSSGI